MNINIDMDMDNDRTRGDTARVETVSCEFVTKRKRKM